MYQEDATIDGTLLSCSRGALSSIITKERGKSKARCTISNSKSTFLWLQKILYVLMCFVSSITQSWHPGTVSWTVMAQILCCSFYFILIFFVCVYLENWMQYFIFFKKERSNGNIKFTGNGCDFIVRKKTKEIRNVEQILMMYFFYVSIFLTNSQYKWNSR